MSRFHIMITVLFVVGAAAIYLSLGGTPLLDPKKTELRSIGGESTSGDASWRYMNGLYGFGVKAQNLSRPPKGAFYATWLIDGKNALFIGKLQEIELNKYIGHYTLQLAAKENLNGFEKIMITLETIDDAQPEKPILEGNFSN